MKRCYIVHTDKTNETEAYREVLQQLTDDGEIVKPVFAIFASDHKNFPWYTKRFASQFPDAVIIGTTSFTLFSSTGHSEKGLTMLVVTSGLKVSTGVLFEASRYPARYASAISDAIENIGEVYDTCCLEFSASSEKCEEMIMDTFSTTMKGINIPVVGATSARDDSYTKASSVSLNGIVYVDACVFAFIHNLEGRIKIIRENIFKPTSHFFTVTDVDCDERIIYELDHKPAASAIADALGTTIESLKTSTFMHPLGKPFGNNQYNIVAIDSVNPDMSVNLLSKVYNQTKVVLMQPKDSVTDVWRDTAYRLRNVMREPAFSFVINCESRTEYFEEYGILDEFNEWLTSFYRNFVGASLIGEQMNFEHFNQSMLVVAFE